MSLTAWRCPGFLLLDSLDFFCKRCHQCPEATKELSKDAFVGVDDSHDVHDDPEAEQTILDDAEVEKQASRSCFCLFSLFF